MSQLQELKASVLEDGVVDADEVKKIEEVLFDDGEIDRDEANFLFEINDAVSGKDNDAGWQALFVKAITAHVLADDTSPGVVDDDEAAWLKEKLEGDGQIDDVEKALLAELKDKAKDPIPATLSELFSTNL